MNLNDFAAQVYQNAVEHGFWQDAPELETPLALIHAEWSEALEEYRAGRPMVWYECTEGPETREPFLCTPEDESDCLNYGREAECEHRSKKPEGIAVELIDGCLRILDLFGRYGMNCDATAEDLINRVRAKHPNLSGKLPLPMLVCELHSLISIAYETRFIVTSEKSRSVYQLFEDALGLVFLWLKENGLDPEKLMVEKHEYNKTRPYLHGKKF